MDTPMDRYMSTSRKAADVIRRFFMTGVSRSASASSSSLSLSDARAPRSDAPYPASCTALMISDGEAVPSTPIEFVSRLTAQPVTPGILLTAFSTRA